MLKRNPEAKEHLIQVFMDNRRVLATNDMDYMLTKLLNIIGENPRPRSSRAKDRSQEPIQEAGLKQQLDEWMEAENIGEADHTLGFRWNIQMI